MLHILWKFFKKLYSTQLLKIRTLSYRDNVMGHTLVLNKEALSSHMPQMRKKFSIPHAGIKNCFLVKLRHVTGKHFCIENRMLCSILFSIVNTEIGKKVHFLTIKIIFAAAFLF